MVNDKSRLSNKCISNYRRRPHFLSVAFFHVTNHLPSGLCLRANRSFPGRQASFPNSGQGGLCSDIAVGYGDRKSYLLLRQGCLSAFNSELTNAAKTIDFPWCREYFLPAIVIKAEFSRACILVHSLNPAYYAVPTPEGLANEQPLLLNPY